MQQNVADALFVGTVYICVQQADANRLDAFFSHLGGELSDLDLINVHRHSAVSQRPFGDAPGQVTRHDGIGIFDLRIEHVVAMFISDKEHVLEAFGHEQRRRLA